MDEAAKRYARRILIAHLAVFVGLIFFVVFAAREVYLKTRTEVIQRTTARQTILLNQTARGIESFYDGLVDDLDLMRRAADDGVLPLLSRPMPAREADAPAEFMWKQLDARASNLFVYTKADASINTLGFDNGSLPVTAVVQKTRPWLDGITAPSVSKMQTFDGGATANLVCVPTGDGKRVIVATVPVAEIDRRFMREVNKQAATGLTLVDETLATMATSNTAMVGMNLMTIPDPQIQDGVRRIVAAGSSATLVFEKTIDVQGVQLRPAIVSAEPVRLPSKTWWVYIATSLAEVDSEIVTVFRRAIVWAGVAIVGLTGVLLSTAIVLIRERVRTERMQHDMLRRELDQAREIQLAWLPETDRGVTNSASPAKAIDVAALNVPASHISGDFYNWFDLPDGRTVVVIGDVTGHGMSAAFLMATTQLLVRTTMPRVLDPGKCLEEVNRQLCVQVFSGQFVTMSLLVLDLKAGIVEVATAGHPAPMVSGGGAYEELAIAPELVLGIEPDVTYPTERFPLPPRASILLYTDGVPDAQAPDGSRLETDGLRTSLTGRYASAQGLVDATVRVVDNFRGPKALNDDLTLVGIQLESAVVPAHA